MSLAALPMHQHINVLNLMPIRLLVLTTWPTSSVFTNVTIGMGDDIHRLNASDAVLGSYLRFHCIARYTLIC